MSVKSLRTRQKQTIWKNPPSPVCVWYPQVRGTFFFFLSACTCVLSACVCVFWGFVGARRGELGWEEGKKPQSSRAPATSPPPVLSSLRAPRQQGRRPLLIRDAADPLENRGPLRRGFLCRLELGCQGSLFAPTEPGVPPRPWEGLAAAAGADETAGSPLREGGGASKRPRWALALTHGPQAVTSVACFLSLLAASSGPDRLWDLTRAPRMLRAAQTRPPPASSC